MLLELKEDSPLYGKKGTIANESILKMIPPKHHSLFVEHVRKRESKSSEYGVKPLDMGELERYLNEVRNRPQPRNNPLADVAEVGFLPVNGDENHDVEPDGEFNYEPFGWNDDEDEDHEWNDEEDNTF